MTVASYSGCAGWRAARAQQEKNWAEFDLATGWGYLNDRAMKLDMAPLDRMQGIEFHLGQWTRIRCLALGSF